MKLICISASNIRHAGNDSTSLKICHLIQKIIAEKQVDEITTDIIALVNYELNPCIGCGSCFTKKLCVIDPVFNALYARLIQADGAFIVSPHYAPIPAKLCMLLEKIEQLAFLPRFHDDSHRSALYQRPVGIIGHGGGKEDISRWYEGPVLDTIANALSWPVEMKIMKMRKDLINGVVLPVKAVRHDPESIFPVQEYDWADIKQRIEPLIEAVLTSATATG